MRRIAAWGALAGLVLAPAAAEAAKPSSGPRAIAFSGRTWAVKSSAGAVGPGPNRFSNSSANVWVDAADRLHLKITYSKGRWYCAEVVLVGSLGRGTYRWTLDTPVDALDPNVTLGLFTWNDDPAYNHREIDYEAARWGWAGDPTNSQFVVQPYDHAGNLFRFTLPFAAAPTIQEFDWGIDRVDFRSVNGADPVSSPATATWTYAGADVPLPGGESPRMNLWLFGGHPPTDGRSVEVVVRSFAFVPAS